MPPVSKLYKKINRNVQGMPQSQTAANPRHQEEEKKDKNIHAQNKQTHVRESKGPAPSSPSEVIRMLKQMEKRGYRPREDFGGRGGGGVRRGLKIVLTGDKLHPWFRCNS